MVRRSVRKDRYHFACINLQEDEAERIRKFYCENCHVAGMGTTECASALPYA